MKLSLDLVNQNVVKSDGTVWKSISTWVNGGSGNEEYYDISSCGDYWSNFSHFVKKSEFNPVTCYAKFKFTNITFKKSTIIQLREFSSVLPVNPYVDITATGKLVLNGNEYDTVDFTNSFIEVYITLYLGVCTTKVKIDNTTEYSDSFTYTKNFSDMVIQLGAKEGNVYSLPTSTYLYDFYLTDDIINTGDTSGKYLDKTGLSSVWSKIKSLFALKSEIPDTSNLQEKLVAGTNISITGNVISSTGSGSSGVDLSSYATKTEVGAKADDSSVVHTSGNETIDGIKTFSNRLKSYYDMSGIFSINPLNTEVYNLDINAETGLPNNGYTFSWNTTCYDPKFYTGIYTALFKSGEINTALRAYKYKDSSKRSDITVGYINSDIDNASYARFNCSRVFPISNATTDLGTSTNKWKTLYATSIFGGDNNIDCSVDSQGDDWIRYSSGLQICWGITSNGGKITLLRPFVSAPAVVLTPFFIGVDSAEVGATGVTASGFTCYESKGNSANIGYIAIGKWK